MTEERVLSLLPFLPGGTSEIYFHPAAKPTASPETTARGHRSAAELAALLSPEVQRRVGECGLQLCRYADLAGA